MTKTVKVRIALIVAADGDWNAVGWSGQDDDSLMSTCMDGMESPAPEAHYFLTAEVEVPGKTEISATVSHESEQS